LAERHAELLPGVLRDRRQAHGQAFLALMEVHDEVPGGEHAKAKSRIEQRRRSDAGHDGEQEERAN